MTFAALAFVGILATGVFLGRYLDDGKPLDAVGTAFCLLLIVISLMALGA